MRLFAPILFSSEMVRADLDGKKCETRRVMIPQPGDAPGIGPVWKGYDWHYDWIRHCPYGEPGTTLWIRESWAVNKGYDDTPPKFLNLQGQHEVWYMADGPKPEWCGRTRPGIFLPMSLSRTTRTVKEILCERVQDITEEEAENEGVDFLRHIPDSDETLSARELFRCLWDSINENRGFGWDTNPWVWVVKYWRGK